MNKPLVSICCITYNHAFYIKEAIDGFLMQKTNFAFEVIIHDDASTDGTKEIIEEYVKKYPNIIIPYYQKENQYSKGVRGIMARYNFPRCRGKYIALCEGDDYWTDPLKLQKQVDFLEANPQHAFCHSLVEDLYSDGRKTIKNDFKETIEFESILKENTIRTCSVVFRNFGELNNLKEVFRNMPFGDWPLYLWLTRDGLSAGQLNETMAVYRKNIGIISKVESQNGTIIDKIIDMQEKLLQIESFKHKFPTIKNQLKKNRLKYLKFSIQRRKPILFIKTFFWIIFSTPILNPKQAK